MDDIHGLLLTVPDPGPNVLYSKETSVSKRAACVPTINGLKIQPFMASIALARSISGPLTMKALSTDPVSETNTLTSTDPPTCAALAIAGYCGFFRVATKFAA